MDAGGPRGVVNIVPGYGEAAGAALAEHPGVDKVAFTGSHVIHFIMKNAPASEQPPGTVQANGKFCDLDPDWSGHGTLNIQ
jgi:aldehyde dehydrogenase (NAD+)